jgi:DNA repair exonuclease SbcCD ATPase subunit
MLYQKELSSIEESISVIEQSIKRTQRRHNTIECPACQHNFIHGSTETNQDEVKALEAHFVKLNNRRTQLREACGSDQVEDLNELAAILVKCANKKKSLSKDFIEAQTRHSALSKQLSKLEATNLNISSIEERNNKAQFNIDKLTLKQSEALVKLASITSEIDLLKQAKAIFSPSGLPAYILDAAVNLFNERVAFYLSKIWVNADFFLNTYKETKGGDIKAKMSESFYNLGQTRSISSLSGGEYRLLCIAVDMAIIDMFSSMTGTEVQFIAWDEPFNGLDASNRARIWPILTQFAESREVWLIDHSTEFKSMFSNVIEIHKRDGISSVV